MKKTAIAALAGIGFATPAFADPLEGIWQTEADNGAYAYVEIGPCGGAWCGVIDRTFNSDGEYQSENLGRQLVIDMEPRGGGEYRGSVWRPSNDNIYIGKMTLNDDSVRLRGCIAGGLICSSQTWTRVQ